MARNLIGQYTRERVSPFASGRRPRITAGPTRPTTEQAYFFGWFSGGRLANVDAAGQLLGKPAGFDAAEMGSHADRFGSVTGRYTEAEARVEFLRQEGILS